MGPKIQEIVRGMLLTALRVLDIVLIMISFGAGAAASVGVTHWTAIASFFASKVTLSSCVLFAITILVCQGLFSLCGLYESKRLATKRAEVFDVLYAMSLATA